MKSLRAERPAVDNEAMKLSPGVVKSVDESLRAEGPAIDNEAYIPSLWRRRFRARPLGKIPQVKFPVETPPGKTFG